MTRISPFALAAFLTLSACRDAKKEDPALASDLALASQVQAAQPQFTDTAQQAPVAAPATVQRAPSRIESSPSTRVVPRVVTTPAPAPITVPAATSAASSGTGSSAASTGAIGAGTSFRLASQQRICSASNRPGDRFVATLVNDVTGSNGAVIPAGASVVLEVASAGSGSADAATMTLRVAYVEFSGKHYPLSGDVQIQSDLEKQRVMDDPNADKKKVLGGAAAGAILGQIIGKNTKGTIIGAATGAAAGAVVAKAGERWQGCLPVGGQMRLTLDQSIAM